MLDENAPKEPRLKEIELDFTQLDEKVVDIKPHLDQVFESLRCKAKDEEAGKYFLILIPI